MRLNHRRVGQGEPLVLVHGIGSRWQVWEPVLDRLRSEREVVALDLPGFGDAPIPPPPGLPAGSASLSRLVGDFLDEEGLQCPHVAGNSLGGLIALELAKQGRARSVTALSPAGFFSSSEAIYARLSLQATVRLARIGAPVADRLLARPRARTLLLGQLFARPERVPAAVAAASARAMARAPWFDDTLAAIGRERFSGGEGVSVPVAVAWGERDRLLPPGQLRRAAAALPGARILVLRGCGHVAMYDDPEQVADVLLSTSAAARATPREATAERPVAG